MKKLLLNVSSLSFATTKPLTGILAVLTLVFSMGGVSFGATLPASDGFNYPAGWDLGQQSVTNSSTAVFRWTHIGIIAGQTATINVGSENLSYPGLATSVGNSLTNPAGPGRGLRFHSSSVNVYNNPMFYSAALKVNSLGNLSTSGLYIMALNNASTIDQTANPTTIPARLYLRLSSTAGKFNVGVAWGNSTVTPTYVATDFSPGASVFVVVRGANFTAGGNATVWANPSASDFGAGSPPSGGSDNSTGTAPNNTIHSLLVVNQASTTMSWTLDDVRIGTTWASVTPTGPPGFTSQPSNSTVDYGANAIFNATAAGSGGAITYQWKKNASNLSDGTTGSGSVVSGATTASLTIAGAAQADEDSYTVTATDLNGTATSSAATLTVNDPRFTSQPSPSALTLVPGQTATFTTAAAGTPTLTYQWKKNGSEVVDGTFDSTVISGAQTASLTIQSVRSCA